ncbi:MAG TPA: hypothetical protein VMU50_00135 [Polyangia bacterium]|nr:hypothetical protein [Polyangia bacterium]
MTRQQLLILYLANSDLGSPAQAWSFYDGTGARTAMAGDSEAPPYPSALAAMQDGWRVIQLPALRPPQPGNEHMTSYLRFEVVLEKMISLPGAP